MAGLQGADVQALNKLASDLGTNFKGQLETLTSTIDQAVLNSANNIWIGPDAEQFRNSDWPAHKTSLTNAITALAEASQTASRNAQAQEQTSSGLA